MWLCERWGERPVERKAVRQCERPVGVQSERLLFTDPLTRRVWSMHIGICAVIEPDLVGLGAAVFKATWLLVHRGGGN